MYNRKGNSDVKMLRACLIVTLISMYNCGTDEFCGRNCVLNKKTFICRDVPICIPEGITNVEVSTYLHSVIITSSNFTGENWDKVTDLRIADRELTLSNASFVALESLTELHLEIERLTVDPNALVGLSKVKVMNFTGCHSLNMAELQSLLNGTNKLPGLNKIVLSDWNKWNRHYDFDDSLIDILLPRNISVIDISNSNINLLNLTTILKRMKHLKSVNASYSTFGEIFFDNVRLDDIKHLQILDLSWIWPPNQINYPPVRYVFNNFTDYFNPEKYVDDFLSIHNINFTGIFKKPFSVWINNSQLISTRKIQFLIKVLELKDNNINRLDYEVVGSNLKWDLEYFGLSKNDLEFLHSSFLSCMPNLTRLDLSRNRLYIMHAEDPQQFGQLLSGVPAITYINLSTNNLTHIPLDFFKGCRDLSTIDLSYNRLTQFTFNVAGLTNVSMIDMRSNNIKTLDARSLRNMNSFLSSESGNVGTSDVILTSNPISCSVCNAKPFLQWLISTRLVDVELQGLKCINEKGDRIAIDEKAISAVHYICIRSTIILSVTVSTTTALISAIAVIVLLYKRRARANKLAHRETVIGKIQEGEGRYEFPVFFSYSSKDETFAQENVLPHLNTSLRLVARINHDRNLVCTGDAYLRPGFYVHDEIDICLDRSSVVLILVTENYCVSDYCGNELEKAYMKKNPVILMFKEHVREDLMSRTMRDIYKRNVRVLWAEQNGEFILQTTWENVCTSIIDLMGCFNTCV